MKKCTKCNSEQPDGMAFCTNCGASMDNASMIEENRAEEELTSSVEEKPVVTPEPAEPEPTPSGSAAPEPPIQVVSSEEKKTSHAGLIVVVVIAILFGIGGIVAAVIFGINSSKHGGGDDPANPPAEVVETPPEVKGTRVEIGGGYTVLVPDEYVYSYDEEGDVFISDETEEEWGFYIFYMSDNYTKIKNNMITVAAQFRENFSDVSYGDTEVDGVEIYYVDLKNSSDIYETVAYMEASDSKTISADVVDGSGMVNHDNLKYVIEIFNTAEKQTTVGSRGLENSVFDDVVIKKIDLSGLSE